MIYGLWLRLRHLAYNKGWKKSFKADVPTICVGNITVGGTGKFSNKKCNSHSC